MDFDTTINKIIDKGESFGLDGMIAYERIIYLISEAEVYCDMEGIDSFVDHYKEDGIKELIEGYRKIGANELSETFSNLINAEAHEKGEILDELNEMITSRKGYNSGSIKNW